MSLPFDHVKTQAPYHASLIRQLQRTVVWRYVESIIPLLSGTEILELKKGTREDAQLFQGPSESLEATDLTAESLQQLRLSTSGVTMASQVCSHIVDPNHLDETYFTKQFDLVVADFDELSRLSPTALQNFFGTLPMLLTPRGRFIGIFKTRFCFWSLIWRLCTLRFGKLMTRLHTTELLPRETEFRYQPERIKKLCKKAFTIKTLQPIGFVLPPLELNDLFKNKSSLLIKLLSLEKRFDNVKYLAGFADYFLIDVQVR